MDEFAKGKNSNSSVQSLTESIQSLRGFKEHLTPVWVESVCRIINDLPSLKLGGNPSPSLKQDESKKDEAVTKIQGDISLLNIRLNDLNTQRKRTLNEYQELKGNIRVFCRICPLLGEERRGNERPVVTSDSTNVSLKITDNKSKRYDFDKVFHPHSTQDEVFSEIEPVLKSALDGYNVCIFAYGQTGTGKTYTMEGRPECPGVVPRGIEALFAQALESNYRLDFSFSMLEIYMGRLRDLLVSHSKKPRVRKANCLPIQRGPDGGIEIENLVAVEVSNYKQVQKLYKLGSHCRSTAPTRSNATSSRSHCLIRISITCSEAAGGRRRETNKIWMVDLGGSERLIKTQASGRRLEEGKAINLSLSALGDVISALQSKRSHVPYRNSKLTQVLRDSLGSDSKTLMLVHISPKEEDMCETVCSLGFATRVKSIHLGSEEPMETRAKKELAMAELLQKVEDFESECQDVKRDIERLNMKLKHLIGAEPTGERNLEFSHPSLEMIQPNKKDQACVKGSTKASMNLPRFMRPTVCSQRRAGTNHQLSLSVSKKPPVPPKKRRPSSVYAESLTYPDKGEGWQPERGSECNTSTSSHSKWNFSTDDKTECSQETSEYEIKNVIFPEPEKSPKTLAAYLSDKSAIELEHHQTSKLHQKKISVIDDWLQLHVEGQKQSHTQWSKQASADPSGARNLSSDTVKNPNDFKKGIMLNKIVENLDEAMNARGLHDSTEPLKVHGSSSDIADSQHHQIKDSDQGDERIECREVNKPECAASSNEAEAGFGIFLAEKGTAIKKENSASVKMYSEDLVGSTRHDGDDEEIFLCCARSGEPLPIAEDITKGNQKSAALGDSQHVDSSHKEKGTIELLGQSVQMLYAGVLLGLGIQSLGFDHDFFQGLMF